MILYVADDWSLGYTSVMGSEEICVGEQEFRVIFAPVSNICMQMISLLAFRALLLSAFKYFYLIAQ